MARAKSVAAYLIEKFSKLGDGQEGLGGNNDLTNLKLQKLLYFFQVESIKNNGKALFDDKIEAWQYGPVVPSIYNELSQFGAYVITDFDTDTTASNDLSDGECSFINKMFEKYNKYSAWALVQMTHKKGSPWDIVYHGGNGNKQEIKLELLKTAETMPDNG